MSTGAQISSIRRSITVLKTHQLVLPKVKNYAIVSQLIRYLYSVILFFSTTVVDELKAIINWTDCYFLRH